MTRFFEGLLTRQDAIKTARQFSLEQRKRDVDAAQMALDEWTSRSSAAVAGGGKSSLDLAAAAVADAQLKFAVSRQRLIESAGGLFAGTLDPEKIAEAFAVEKRILMAGAPGGDVQRTTALNALETQLEAYNSFNRELSESLLVAQKLRETSSGSSAVEVERQRLTARLAEATALYGAHQVRAQKSTGPGSTPFGLIAPEAIRIIDEPRDPVSPVTSILKIILACLGAGIGLGIGLAAIAEQLDDRIHSPAVLEQLSGVPVLAHLPRHYSGRPGRSPQDRSPVQPRIAERT